jgi:hypothetical protein
MRPIKIPMGEIVILGISLTQIPPKLWMIEGMVALTNFAETNGIGGKNGAGVSVLAEAETGGDETHSV